jgi:predicted CXXCH cytochrome family protein
MRRPLLIAIACLVLVGAGYLAVRQLHRPPVAPEYVGTTACGACHQTEYRNWQDSDHRHAMEVADDQSVLGDFSNAHFDYFGIRSRFFTQDGKYYVETDNAKGELETFPVAYTFGHYPLQQYLIGFPDGRLQPLSISWDSRPAAQGGQRWFHLYPDEKIGHDDPLHWTGAFQNWNSRCASCHSTNLVKNYSPDTDRYDTHWQEINVGCEACHGPGSQHVAWANGERSLQDKGLAVQINKVWEPKDGTRPIPQLAATPLSAQLQVCAGCHSRRSELQQPELTRDYFDNYALSPLLDGRYFADGQMREEVYVAGSFLQSRMHANHVSCTNCHEPHSAKLRAAGNALCLQCHQPGRYQTQQHFFHKDDSAGALCVNCHMPQQTYMGVDARRDHSFRVPDPVASVRFGVPNTCTQCHKDKSDQWAADFITRRTGRTEPYYPQTALLSAARHNDAAVAPSLLAYAGDASHPAILRGTALLESGRFASTEQLDALGVALTSPDPLVRIGAVSALGGMDVRQRLALLQKVLTDPVKAVRMAAAQQLAELPLSAAPAALQEVLGALFDEYRQSLAYNADMPESLSNLGLFQAAQGDMAAAEESLQRARRISPRYLPAMLNLADIYRARNRDDLGEALLREAMAAYPESADVRHMLGLLDVRTGKLAASVPLFQQATSMAPDNAQYALVYGLALVETGRKAEAVRVLQAAAKRFPNDAQIRQALAAYQ